MILLKCLYTFLIKLEILVFIINYPLINCLLEVGNIDMTSTLTAVAVLCNGDFEQVMTL